METNTTDLTVAQMRAIHAHLVDVGFPVEIEFLPQTEVPYEYDAADEFHGCPQFSYIRWGGWTLYDHGHLETDEVDGLPTFDCDAAAFVAAIHAAYHKVTRA